MTRLLNFAVLTIAFYFVAPYVLEVDIAFTKAVAAASLLLIVAEVLHKPAEVIFYSVEKETEESE